MSNATHGRDYWLCVGLTAAVLIISGCAGPGAMQTENDSRSTPNDGLNSTLWSLRSAEYLAVAHSVYQGARAAVLAGLANRQWSALPAQANSTGYSDLPPAVILDADETVIDNGAYQIENVLNNKPFSSESWLSWVLEARAGSIPGALDFTRFADSLGVTVIYLTNRRGNMEAATRENLIRLGFPIDDSFDVVLTRGEREEWAGSQKSGRRDFAAEGFRILALIGDDLNDFVDVDGLSMDDRDKVVEANDSNWGVKWFMMPNPQYGSWERASFDDQFRLTEDEKRALKKQRLQELLDGR